MAGPCMVSVIYCGQIVTGIVIPGSVSVGVVVHTTTEGWHWSGGLADCSYGR